MPLPFLTADRAFDQAVDEALPFEDRDRWRRPYRPGPWRVGAAALLLLLASYVLVAAVVIAVAETPRAGAICFGAALLVIGCALRLLRVGIWVSARGVRQVGFFRTRTASWEASVSVRTVQQPVRWLGLPRSVQGQALLLVRTDHVQEYVTPLMTTHNADFLARTEAFDRAADTIEAWAAEYGRAA
ncbi:hypothetical protein PV367_34020 [Streptomyces europaeiscabiei]|uniref:Uncharacterized protein n=1 Tax=Streptomyces europaeiscabiei TaxID=146819 RepID=A0AAJ2PW64_9ACTN|nr:MULTISPECIES: hypothetical protein [Streptomyces]MDX2528606.1 hypothetical protein [Streptomyces europaeiscabiei]MDX2763669.1 hypothetical protein [Streptomyces europaeiscabiei]MDX2769116.1 hypothetical protein [Streptomyces europaeiscabiei]MDX3134692.1 hypothetical protein [Streptomyces europaeiscabiei]MDX3548832.1 hypothetical protein [Streptomyces europaeiscabiei]